MTLLGVLEAVKAELEPLGADLDPVPNELQVTAHYNITPVSPSLDIYPGGDPSQEGLSYDSRDRVLYVTVRARVSTAANVEGQLTLFQLMDSDGEASVVQALLGSKLGGAADTVNVTGPSDMVEFVDRGGRTMFLGCTWQLAVYPSRNGSG
jgi:hypothetical protein